MADDSELERFKALNLGEVAASYGYTLDRRQKTDGSPADQAWLCATRTGTKSSLLQGKTATRFSLV